MSRETGSVNVDVGNGCCGAGARACRVAAAQITLDHLTRSHVVINRAERARDRTNFTPDAARIDDDLCTGGFVDWDGAYRTCLHAPGFGALGTGIRSKPTLVVEGKDLDA